MTIENTIKTAESILADFHHLKREIVTRRIAVPATHMLIWKFTGSSLFVGRRPKAIETSATGFNWAITFTSFDQARRYVERTQIRNGRDEQPVPIAITDAREIALADIDGVIETAEKLVAAKKEA